MSGSLLPWGQVGQTLSFSPVTSGSASSSSPSHGSSWASIYGGVPARCALTTAPHQIRTQSDRLLGPVVTDTDGNSEDRSDTVSVFNGPPPTVHSLKSESEQTALVGNWIAERAKAGVLAHEFGVFVRSAAQLNRARAAVKAAGLALKILDEHVESTTGTSRSAPCTSPKVWSFGPL
jgi:hypothetical protein